MLTRRSRIFGFRKLSFLFILAFVVSLYTFIGSLVPPLNLPNWTSPPLQSLSPTPYAPPPIPEACERCSGGKGSEICSSLGEDALIRSVSHSGTNARLRRFLSKLRAGKPVQVSVLGGSVSKGQGLERTTNSPDLVHNRIFSFLNETYPNLQHRYTNGAVGATGSAYFQYCFKEHIPEDSDLVLVELGINDQNVLDTQNNYEMLIRTLLELPNSPALLSIETFGLMFQQILNGGDLHLSIAAFYDVPVISLRSVVLPSIMRGPKLANFAQWFSVPNKKSGEPDLRHLGAKGHGLAGDLIIAYIEKELCEMDRLESRYGSGSSQTAWDTIGSLDSSPPPMLLTEKFDPERSVAPAKPQCQSTNSPRQKLSVPAGTEGWTEWSSSPNKNYLIATEPHARLSLPFSTSLGQVVVSYLRSATFDLGMFDCWVDGDVDKKVRMDGWWKLEKLNIAQTMEIRNNLLPGDHMLHCEVAESTHSRGHEVRLISVMSL